MAQAFAEIYSSLLEACSERRLTGHWIGPRGKIRMIIGKLVKLRDRAKED
eukprot:CAMPEP_0170642370 /NCGR_PEP_ID=MMETSP0224-20130122/41285_1 /TAXON_ID=285029 /ORGANISM="Togula jolla, Strain CCCM 725" /LENGTH=49 /DNA_ID=CAMNT_0010973065 /DNA_START=133 /DNA_END=282 /DNA_ORIENTATION=+